MANIKSIESNSLSFYRTQHHFQHYGEVSSLEELGHYCQWAKNNGVKVYILGNGSNTLFTRKRVNTLVLKNNLSKSIKPLSDNRVEISSSVLISDVLKYCYENSLDSFYYLASVPATIGGALAMNAGRNQAIGDSIYDFVESITFFDGDCVKTLKNHEVERQYRTTMFTGLHSRLIISAIFKFPSTKMQTNPLLDRRCWAKEHQDNIAPNCGSVFKASNFRLLKTLKGLSIGGTCFSTKTENWILNKSKSSSSILALILVARLLHLLVRKKIALELITVD